MTSAGSIPKVDWICSATISGCAAGRSIYTQSLSLQYARSVNIRKYLVEHRNDCQTFLACNVEDGDGLGLNAL